MAKKEEKLTHLNFTLAFFLSSVPHLLLPPYLSVYLKQQMQQEATCKKLLLGFSSFYLMLLDRLVSTQVAAALPASVPS